MGERTKKVEPTKEGPGLGPRTGPSLETVPNLGPDLRIGPNQETDLNQNLDLALNPGMTKQKNPIRHHKFENFEKRKILTQHGKIENNFSISFFCQNFLKRSNHSFAPALH